MNRIANFAGYVGSCRPPASQAVDRPPGPQHQTLKPSPKQEASNPPEARVQGLGFGDLALWGFGVVGSNRLNDSQA